MVTLEKTAAGFFRSLLMGGGRQALEHSLGEAAPLISHTGASVAEGRPILGQPLHKSLLGIKDVIVGHRPIDVLKQRAIQGGILGKGGIMRGATAFSPEFQEVWDKHGPLKAMLKNPLSGSMSLLNPALTYGLPAYAVAKGVQNRDPGSIGQALGETLGWGLGMPFNFAGGIVAANPLGRLGRTMFTPKPPEMPRINLSPQELSQFG